MKNHLSLLEQKNHTVYKLDAPYVLVLTFDNMWRDICKSMVFYEKQTFTIAQIQLFDDTEHCFIEDREESSTAMK